MISRHSILAGAAALMFVAADASAENAYTANVTLASDYVFRGISQSQERGAIQGGFDAVLSNGIYGGVWASNVNFDTGARGTSTEVDYYGGYSGSIGCTSCSYKLGFIYYRYEGDTKYDYIEAAGSLTFGGLTVGLNYSPEYLGDGTTDAVGDEVDFYYPYVNYTYALPWDLSLALHGAYNKMGEEGVFEAGQDDYSEWSVGLTKSINGFNFGLTYWDTNTHDLYVPLEGDGSARVVFSLNKVL
jgi:uncharacterized protein (TIGR02001 family)